MPARKLKEFLDRENIKYIVIFHSRSYTAQEAAEYAHISGKNLAKTVIVRVDGRMAMAVLPAPEHIDLELLKGATGTTDITLAAEADFKDQFPGCEAGAMPPFGNLYDMDVYVEEALTEDNRIAFNAGSHVELIELSYQDFERLVKPRIARISTRYTS